MFTGLDPPDGPQFSGRRPSGDDSSHKKDNPAMGRRRPSIGLPETLPLPGRRGNLRGSSAVCPRSSLPKGWRRRLASAPRTGLSMSELSLLWEAGSTLSPVAFPLSAQRARA